MCLEIFTQVFISVITQAHNLSLYLSKIKQDQYFKRFDKFTLPKTEELNWSPVHMSWQKYVNGDSDFYDRMGLDPV